MSKPILFLMNQSKVKSHLIFFKKGKANEIEVVRVLHERMDIENRLAE